MDALNATALLTPAETARITAAVDAVAELAAVQLAMRQVLYPASDATAVFEMSQWLPRIDAKAQIRNGAASRLMQRAACDITRETF